MEFTPIEALEAKLVKALQPIIDSYPELFTSESATLSVFIVSLGNETPILLYLAGKESMHVPKEMDRLIRQELRKWELCGMYEIRFRRSSYMQ